MDPQFTASMQNYGFPDLQPMSGPSFLPFLPQNDSKDVPNLDSFDQILGGADLLAVPGADFGALPGTFTLPMFPSFPTPTPPVDSPYSIPGQLPGQMQMAPLAVTGSAPSGSSSHSGGLTPHGNLLQPSGAEGAQQPPPKNRGGRRSTRTLEEKALAIQEKNRRAQKRFRERQREKMVNMEDSVQSLAEQVKTLAMENNNLQARNSVLEKVLSLRDEQIQQYQQTTKVYDLGSKVTDYRPTASSKSLACGVPMEAVIQDDPVKAIQSKSVEEITAQWKGYVKEMANLLIEYEHAPEENKPNLHAQICKLICSAGQLCMMTAMFSPVHIKKMLAAVATSEERHLQSIGDPVQFWKPLMDQLELTQQQVSEIVKLRAMFVSRTNRLLEERRAVTEDMRKATTADLNGNELRSATRDVVRLHELTTALHANLRDEHSAGFDLVATMFRKVLPALSLARVLVHSYPLYPDAFALATCIAQHHGQLDASPSQLMITAA